MAEMRESIGNGTFQQMRQRVMGVWGS